MHPHLWFSYLHPSEHRIIHVNLSAIVYAEEFDSHHWSGDQRDTVTVRFTDVSGAVRDHVMHDPEAEALHRLLGSIEDGDFDTTVSAQQ